MYDGGAGRGRALVCVRLRAELWALQRRSGVCLQEAEVPGKVECTLASYQCLVAAVVATVEVRLPEVLEAVETAAVARLAWR